MTLMDRDHVRYLTNVLCAARADRAISSAETSAIDAVRVSIGAKKGALSAAQREAETPTCSALHLDNFEARVANVADMLSVALADGDLGESEERLVREFAKTVPLTDDQFEILLREAVSKTEERSGQRACAKCGTMNSRESKFCSNCGTALHAEDATATALANEIPALGYAIEFAESSAAGFQSALACAQAAPTFSSCLKGKKTWYLAAWPTDQFALVARLAELLAGIRNRRSYCDSVEVPWEELFGFLWCAKNRQSSYKPPLYCFGQDDNQLNPWGCKVAQLPWTEWGRWFSYGEWRRVGLLGTKYLWCFDKARIRHELMTNTHRTKSCPYFRAALVDAVLHALPDQVEATEIGDWKYSRSYDQVPGSIRVVQVERTGGAEYKDEFWADGVRPNGTKALREALRVAFADAGIRDVPLGELLMAGP